MENIFIKNLLGKAFIFLAAGSMLVACGGSDSKTSSDNQTKLLASVVVCNTAWSSTKSYVGGNQISHNGKNYTAAYWNQNSNPSVNNGAAGSGQPWITGPLCGNQTTTTSTTSTTNDVNSCNKIDANGNIYNSCLSTTSSTTTTTVAGPACQAYVAGHAYTYGQNVSNVGKAFRCDVAGWCSLGVSAYEPGVGWASSSAWSPTDACKATTTSTTTTTVVHYMYDKACPDYVSGKAYTVGQKVFNASIGGPGYQCIASELCSQSAAQYAPGSGSATTSAWTPTTKCDMFCGNGPAAHRYWSDALNSCAGGGTTITRPTTTTTIATTTSTTR